MHPWIGSESRDDVVDLPKGTMALNDMVIQALLAEDRARGVLELRSHRLVLMGHACSDADCPNGSGFFGASDEVISKWERDGELGPAEPVP
jgi:hypothetical protein